MRQKRITIIATIIAVLGILALGSCDTSGSETGIMELSMTDAPLMEDGVNGVYITVEEVQYNSTGNSWAPMEGFDAPQTFDLLALTGGDSRLLGQLQLPAGNYTQIRFILGATEQGNPVVQGSPGSWVEYGNNDTYDPDPAPTGDGDKALFVPSGEQTGYKASARDPFAVPANGSVAITADFDLRRAVVETANGFILKPRLRLIVEDEAGRIVGEDADGFTGNYVAYAYEAGSYTLADETAAPGEGESRFPNAVTSGEVENRDDGGDFILPFLAPGEYDVVVAEYDADGAYIDASATVVASGETVSSDSTTSVSIDL